jgi:serine/threonine protein kinase/outer membrane protein assembly factor BamB
MPGEVDLGIDELSGFDVIGTGGFSTVYAAWDEGFNRRVAVKLLHSLDEAGQRRFNREREIMGQLSSHPNVIMPFRAGYTATGAPFLVMELVLGGSLQDLIDQHGRVSWPEATDYVLGATTALGHAHERNILHRDVKPANILLSDNVPKLTDFGIAAIRESTASQVAYTLAHCPPETFESGRDTRDERSDLYSMASTLFCMLAGTAPFDVGDHDSQHAYMFRIIEHQLPELPPGVAPEPLREFLRAALAKDAALRPQSAAEFLSQLARIRSATGPPPAGQHVTGPEWSSAATNVVATGDPLQRGAATPPTEVLDNTADGAADTAIVNPPGRASSPPSEAWPPPSPKPDTSGPASTGTLDRADVSDPGVSGPRVSGPGVSGPGVSGPGVSGPGVSGPGVSGPGVSGPGVSGSGVSGPGGESTGGLPGVVTSEHHGLVGTPTRRRKAILPALLALIVIAGLAAAGWWFLLRDVDTATGPEVAWTFETGSSLASRPAVADGVLVIGANVNDTVYGLDTATGLEVWRYKTGDSVVANPVIVDDVVYIGSHDGSMYALDFDNGEPIWEQAVDSEVTGGALATENAVVFGTDSGEVWALDRTDGEPIWTFETGGMVNSTPVEAVMDGQDIIAVGSTDGGLYLLDPVTGKQVERIGLEGGVWFSIPLVVERPNGSGQEIWIGSSGQNEGLLNRIDLDRLEVATFNASAGVGTNPVMTDDGLVIAGNDIGELFAVDRVTLGERWREGYAVNTQIKGSPVVVGDQVIFGTHGKELIAVTSDDGAEVWRFEGEQIFGLSSPVAVGDQIYVGNDSGTVYRFDL